MRQIIDGKRYDTETAKEVSSWSSPHFCNDFHYYEETLFRTAKGSWFLYGEGNAASPWSEACCDGRGPGKGIRVLSAEQAKEWLEEHEDTEGLEEHFGREIEDA